MPNDNVKDMVNSLAGGDNIKAQDAFKNALSDKIGQALDDKRQSVATDWLNSAQDQEAIKDASGLDAGASSVVTPGQESPVEEPVADEVEIDQGGEDVNQLSFQKFKKTLTELKEDSPKETAEFKKLSPAEKQAVKDVFTLLGNTKGEIITKVDGIIKQVAKKRNVKVSAIEDYFDNEILKLKEIKNGNCNKNTQRYGS